MKETLHQVCTENVIGFIKEVLAGGHVHMFVSIPPKISVSDLMRKMKSRRSHKVQCEFPELGKSWAGDPSPTRSGIITEQTGFRYLKSHTKSVGNPLNSQSKEGIIFQWWHKQPLSKRFLLKHLDVFDKIRQEWRASKLSG